MGVGAAAIGAGVIGAGASIISSNNQANAVKSASNAQVQQDQAALNLQQQQWAQTQANMAPWLKAGQGALTGYGDLIGSNGTSAQTSAIGALQNNPLYLAETGAGNQAILANASATGGLRSGNANYNLAQFNANTLANVYQQQLQSLGSLSSLGENAAGNLGNTGVQYANLGTNTYNNIGSAQSGGILGSSGALTGGINSGLSSLLGGLSTANYLGAFGGSSGLGVINTPTTIGDPSSALDGLF